MKVFIAGATGAIGRPLVKRLVAAGHEVFGMTRSQEKGHSLAREGVVPVVVDAFDVAAVHATLQRIKPEGVIEQLTSLPQTYTQAAMQAAAELNSRLRREGGANVQAAAQAAGTRRYLIQSTGFWYAPGPGLADETTPFADEGTPAISTGTRTYAAIEQRVLSAPGLEGIVLRYGFFYGPGTWYAREGNIANRVRRQDYPIVGDGRGVWSFIHVQDAAEATVAALEHGQPGVYNIVDDDPVEQRVWLPAYAAWLGAPPPLQLDAAEVTDPDTIYYATRLRGASNARAKRDLGWQPRALEWLTREPTG